MSSTYQNIPTLSQWKSSTAVWNKRRSSQLKKVDDAISKWENQGQTDLLVTNIKEALNAWCKSKGGVEVWTQNERNKTGKVKKLYEIVNGQIQSSYLDNLANSRYGVLFLLGNLKVDANMVDILIDAAGSTAGSIFSSTTTYGWTGKGSSTEMDYKLIGGGSSAATGLAKNALVKRDLKKVAVPELAQLPEQSLWVQFKTKFTEFFEWLWKKIIGVFAVKKVSRTLVTNEAGGYREVSSNQFDYAKFYGTFKAIMLAAVAKIFESAAPFVQDIAAVTKHIYNFGKSVIQATSAFISSCRVQMLKGHPGLICKALRNSMLSDASASLYQTIKYSLSITINAMFPGVGAVATTIVKTILYVVEKAIEYIRRYTLLTNVRDYLSSAKQHYLSAKAKDKKSGLHLEEEKFTAWYRSVIEDAPILAALTLNSGICGDAMHFIKMFNNGDKLISQDKFDIGVSYRNDMKNYSSTILTKTPLQFYCARSGNTGKYINALIASAKGFTTKQPQSEFSKLLTA